MVFAIGLVEVSGSEEALVGAVLAGAAVAELVCADESVG